MMAQNVDLPEFWKSKQNPLNNYLICNVCRLCANICDNVVPIFDKINEKESIYDKLKKCIPSISILESDIKPKQVCLSCVSKLELCVSFIEMSLDSDCKFETVLQNRSIPQIHIINENLLNKSLDLSWLQVKQEPEWTEAKEQEVQISSNEQNVPQVSVPDLPNQVFQPQKSFQQVVQLPVSNSNQYDLPADESNLGMLLNKQDANHNILQSLVVPEGISSQDLIVFVELKCKDYASVSPVTIKKDISGQNVTEKVDELSNFQTKIMDTNGNIRIINLSDFDGKFNQSDKVTSSFISDSSLIDTSDSSPPTSTASILKAIERDAFNGVLKLENLNTASATSLNEMLKTEGNQNFDNIALANTSNVGALRPGPPQSTSRDLSCNICGKRFTRRNRLNAHLARHSSLRPHSCDKCDQRFITRWDLTLHLRIHSGIFSCEFCGKAFPAKGKLERHRRTHTGERPFPCEQCNKAFSEKRNLDNHLKTHAAAEARKVAIANLCLGCGRHFPHTGAVRRTKCDECDKKETAILNALVSCTEEVSATISSKNGIDHVCTSDMNGNVTDVTSSTVTDFLET